jgi:hypothetical protein
MRRLDELHRPGHVDFNFARTEALTPIHERCFAIFEF